MGTIPTTSVTMTAIQTEFGGDGAISLSEYYRGTTAFSSTGVGSGKFVRPEVTAIPLSGAIAVGDFRGQNNVTPSATKILKVGQAEFKGNVTNKGYTRTDLGIFDFGSLRDRYVPIGTSVWAGYNKPVKALSQGSSGLAVFEILNGAPNSTWSSITIGGITLSRSLCTYSVTVQGNVSIARWEDTISTSFLWNRTTGTSVTVSFT